MLELHKDTLTELTPDDLGTVVGGAYATSCTVSSCITTPILHDPESCVVGSCITNG